MKKLITAAERLIVIAELEALRKDIRALTNLLGLVLKMTDPEALEFYAKVQQLEVQFGKDKVGHDR